MGDQYQNGDTADLPDGGVITYKNGGWVRQDTPTPPHVGASTTGNVQVPDTASDAASATLPALERTTRAVLTAPNTLGYLASKGINTLGSQQFPDWQTSAPGKVMAAGEKYFGPKSYYATQQEFEKQHPSMAYQAQTPGGKVWEAGVGAAPLGAIGEGAAIPNMARALASGAASEQAGQATAGSVFETPSRIGAGLLTYGATGGLHTPQINPTTARATQAQTLENAGVPIRASDISGNRFLAMLEGGGAPAGYSQALDQSLKRQAGIPVAGPTPYSQLLNQRQDALGTQGDQLAATTSIPAPAVANLRNQLVASAGTHTGRFSGTSLENPAVQKALDDFDHLTNTGTTPLGGAEYQALHQQWNASGDPVLRNMAKQLDAAMGPQWDPWREQYANYIGHRAISNSMGGAADTIPLNVDPMVSAMHRETPMWKTAQAAQAIDKGRPEPYDADLIGKLGHVAAGAGGIYGALRGGNDEVLRNIFLPEALAQGTKALASFGQPFFRSGPGQRMIRNLDPSVTAALLAQEGVVAKQKRDESAK